MSEGGRLVQLADDLRHEIASLEAIVDEARRCRSDFQQREPSSLELRGAADIVPDFYNAVEHYLERVALELNGGLPVGADWHSTLLARMARELPDVRPAVLRSQLASDLNEYLRFRHLFRHGYGLRLQWSKVLPLLQGIDSLAEDLVADLSHFAERVEKLGRGVADESEP